MRFGKLTLFFVLNGIIALILTFHLGRWVFSDTVTGQIIPPFSPNTIVVHYNVEGKNYSETFMRYDISYFEKNVSVRYLSSDPEVSRINSFMGIYAEPFAWWLVFLIASSALLLTNNAVFSKGTVFQIHKKFPWISMEEYFPLPRRFWRSKKPAKQQKENSTGQKQLPE